MSEINTNDRTKITSSNDVSPKKRRSFEKFAKLFLPPNMEQAAGTQTKSKSYRKFCNAPLSPVNKESDINEKNDQKILLTDLQGIRCNGQDFNKMTVSMTVLQNLVISKIDEAFRKCTVNTDPIVDRKQRLITSFLDVNKKERKSSEHRKRTTSKNDTKEELKANKTNSDLILDDVLTNAINNKVKQLLKQNLYGSKLEDRKEDEILKANCKNSNKSRISNEKQSLITNFCGSVKKTASKTTQFSPENLYSSTPLRDTEIRYLHQKTPGITCDKTIFKPPKYKKKKVSDKASSEELKIDNRSFSEAETSDFLSVTQPEGKKESQRKKNKKKSLSEKENYYETLYNESIEKAEVSQLFSDSMLENLTDVVNEHFLNEMSGISKAASKNDDTGSELKDEQPLKSSSETKKSKKRSQSTSKECLEDETNSIEDINVNAAGKIMQSFREQETLNFCKDMSQHFSEADVSEAEDEIEDSYCLTQLPGFLKNENKEHLSLFDANAEADKEIQWKSQKRKRPSSCNETKSKKKSLDTAQESQDLNEIDKAMDHVDESVKLKQKNKRYRLLSETEDLKKTASKNVNRSCNRQAKVPKRGKRAPVINIISDRKIEPLPFHNAYEDLFDIAQVNKIKIEDRSESELNDTIRSSTSTKDLVAPESLGEIGPFARKPHKARKITSSSSEESSLHSIVSHNNTDVGLVQVKKRNSSSDRSRENSLPKSIDRGRNLEVYHKKMHEDLHWDDSCITPNQEAHSKHDSSTEIKYSKKKSASDKTRKIKKNENETAQRTKQEKVYETPQRKIHDTSQREVQDLNTTVLLESMLENSKTSYDKFQKLKKLHIVITWKMSAVHKNDNFISKDPPEKFRKWIEQQCPIKKGAYTKEEDSIIQKNFRDFCKVHQIEEDPTFFMTFNIRSESGEKYSMKISERQNFVRYLARNLDNRYLRSVYQRFRRLYFKQIGKEGIFTKEEDAIIKAHLRTKTEHPYKELAQILNRDPGSIYKRCLKLQQSNLSLGSKNE